MREKISPNSLRSDGGQSPKNVRVQQGLGGLLEIGRGNEGTETMPIWSA